MEGDGGGDGKYRGRRRSVNKREKEEGEEKGEWIRGRRRCEYFTKLPETISVSILTWNPIL